jgi:hypothetical protein
LQEKQKNELATDSLNAHFQRFMSEPTHGYFSILSPDAKTCDGAASAAKQRGNSTSPAKWNAQELKIAYHHYRILTQTQAARPQIGFAIPIRVYSICRANNMPLHSLCRMTGERVAACEIIIPNSSLPGVCSCQMYLLYFSRLKEFRFSTGCKQKDPGSRRLYIWIEFYFKVCEWGFLVVVSMADPNTDLAPTTT